MTPERLLRILQQHLYTDRLIGLEEVPHSGEASQVPASASQDSPESAPVQSGVRAPSVEPTAVQVARSAEVGQGGAIAPKDSPRTSPHSGGSRDDRTSDDRTSKADASLLPGAGAAPIIRKGMPSAPIYPAPIGPEEKARLLGDMDQREVRGCQKCGLCRGRTHTVFGEGDPNARLMFVGEGPGQAEDEQGRPFVGRAGQLLDKQIKAMGFQREKVYIANVVKCRPPNNRAPLPEEAQACWGYLKRQIATIQPSVIIALGRPAANQLLNNPSVGIMSMRGQWHLFEGLSPDGPPIPTMPTYHPSYILRRYEDVNTRRRVWEDLQKVMAYLKEHPEPGRP